MELAWEMLLAVRQRASREIDGEEVWVEVRGSR